MAIRLPSKFKDVPLGLLLQQLKLGKELKDLAEFEDVKAYWSGWLDSLAMLLSGLTGKAVQYFREDQAQKAERPELVDAYEDFRMEDRLTALEQEMKEERGY